MSWDGLCRLQWPDSEAGALDRRSRSTPVLIRPAQVQLPDLLADTFVDVWPRALYTAAFVGGPAAGALAAATYAAVRQHGDRVGAFIDAIATPPDGAIVHLHDSPTTDASAGS